MTFTEALEHLRLTDVNRYQGLLGMTAEEKAECLISFGYNLAPEEVADDTDPYEND